MFSLQLERGNILITFRVIFNYQDLLKVAVNSAKVLIEIKYKVGYIVLKYFIC